VDDIESADTSDEVIQSLHIMRT